jgi:hypothetical protein
MEGEENIREVSVAGYDIPAPSRYGAFEDAVVTRIRGHDLQGESRFNYRCDFADKSEEFIDLRQAEIKLRVGKHAAEFPDEGGRKMEVKITRYAPEKKAMRIAIPPECGNETLVSRTIFGTTQRPRPRLFP